MIYIKVHKLDTIGCMDEEFLSLFFLRFSFYTHSYLHKIPKDDRLSSYIINCL